jgi:hypothetical protein
MATLHHTTYFERYGHHLMFKIVCCWKLLCFRFRVYSLLLCGPVYAQVYPIAIGRSSWSVVCGPVYALVYSIVMSLSYCCVECFYGLVYALVYSIMMSRSSCCVECVYGLVYALVYSIVMGRYSCCVTSFVLVTCR